MSNRDITRVNGIAPGRKGNLYHGIRLLTRAVFPSDMSAPIVEKYSTGPGGGPGAVPKEMVPLGRMGDEQDMGGTMLYLASRAGSYTNGAVLIVDGGRLGLFPATV